MHDEDIDFINTVYAQEHAGIGYKALLLFFIIICFFAGAIAWAFFSEIDELARGEGKVIPSEKIQKIQSLDGGIIANILIKEGSIVKKGQPLMKIDTTRFQASLEENKQTYFHLLATKIRLEAESIIEINKKNPIFNISDEIQKEVKEFVKMDYKLFLSRIEELKSTVSIFRIQLKQKEQELLELKSEKEHLQQSIVYVLEEKETIEKLVKRRAQSKVELIRINKELNKIEGEIKSTNLAIPRARFAILEAKHRIIEKSKIFRAEASNELQKINTEVKKYKSKLISEKDKVAKTILYSPVDGIVKQINVNTIGGVIKSGMDLIEIVPQSKILLVEAKISPKDIAFINPKQKAIVKITAYDFSIYGGLDGKIVEISADSITDKESKEQKSYYKVVVRTNKNYLEKDGEELPIIPGMVASIDIVTGKKTILNFLLKPILKTKENSFHER